MRENETPGRIVTNFCTGVGVHDVITSANFYDCRLWGLSVVGGQILGFSIDSRCRPYNTLALPCECVIIKNECHSNIIVDRLQGCGTHINHISVPDRSSSILGAVPHGIPKIVPSKTKYLENGTSQRYM